MLKNSKYTVIITNFENITPITENILPVLSQIEEIDKIIIAHCNRYTFVHLDTPNIEQIKAWDDYEQYGVSTKYKIALSESIKTEAIMFIDENIPLTKKICAELFSSWSSEQSLIHGIDSASIHYDVKKTKYVLINDSDPHIIFTTLCVVSQSNINEAFAYALTLTDIMEQCTPKYAGIDICLSVIAACSNKTKLRLHRWFEHAKSRHDFSEWTSNIYSDILTITIKKYFNRNKTIFINTQTPYKGLIVIIPFFNFASFNQLCANISDMVYKLNAQQVSIVVMEAVLTGSISQLYTLPCDIITTETDTIAFHKEGLFNKAFNIYKEYYDIFVLSDADIIFANNGWPQILINEMKKGADIVQPYKTCHWTKKDGSIDFSKPSYSSFRAENYNSKYNRSKMKCVCDKFKYHPGFVWAFSTNFLLKTNGLFSKCFSGSGDIMTVHLGEGIPINKNTWDIFEYLQPELNNFLIKGGGNYGSMSGEIYHLYHGSRDNRGYYDRHTNITRVRFNIGPKFFSPELKDHLINAIDPKVNDLTLAYFKSRNEDD